MKFSFLLNILLLALINCVPPRPPFDENKLSKEDKYDYECRKSYRQYFDKYPRVIGNYTNCVTEISWGLKYFQCDNPRLNGNIKFTIGPGGTISNLDIHISIDSLSGPMKTNFIKCTNLLKALPDIIAFKDTVSICMSLYVGHCGEE